MGGFVGEGFLGVKRTTLAVGKIREQLLYFREAYITILYYTIKKTAYAVEVQLAYSVAVEEIREQYE